MSTPWQTLAEAVQEQIEAIPDIGRVHRRVYYLKDRGKFHELVQHTDADGRNVLRGWFIQPGGSTVSSELDGLGDEVSVMHQVPIEVTGIMPVHEDDDGTGSYDVMEGLAWEVKRVLDAWQPHMLPGFAAMLLTTGASIGAPEMRVLPTGELCWAISVSRTFIAQETAFSLDYEPPN